MAQPSPSVTIRFPPNTQGKPCTGLGVARHHALLHLPARDPSGNLGGLRLPAQSTVLTQDKTHKAKKEGSDSEMPPLEHVQRHRDLGRKAPSHAGKVTERTNPSCAPPRASCIPNSRRLSKGMSRRPASPSQWSRWPLTPGVRLVPVLLSSQHSGTLGAPSTWASQTPCSLAPPPSSAPAMGSAPSV